MSERAEEATKVDACGAEGPPSLRYRRALAEGEKLRQFLAPYAGLWVALSADWSRVLAHDADRLACVGKAKELAQRGEVPCFYRVPADAA